MSLVSPQPGDLVAIDCVLDNRILFYQLRHFLDKKFYISPMLMVTPGDTMLVLLIEDDDLLVYTAKGYKGWINKTSLMVISHFKDRIIF